MIEKKSGKRMLSSCPYTKLMTPQRGKTLNRIIKKSKSPNYILMRVQFFFLLFAMLSTIFYGTVGQ